MWPDLFIKSLTGPVYDTTSTQEVDFLYHHTKAIRKSERILKDKPTLKRVGFDFGETFLLFFQQTGEETYKFHLIVVPDDINQHVLWKGPIPAHRLRTLVMKKFDPYLPHLSGHEATLLGIKIYQDLTP